MRRCERSTKEPIATNPSICKDSWASCGYDTLNCAILSKYELLRSSARRQFASARRQIGTGLFRWNFCRFRSKFALWVCLRPGPWNFFSIGRNAATRVHSNPGSSADQFDWEGCKIYGNRKKTPRKCPFQGRNLKVTTSEEGRGKEKVETCSVAVPSEVGFFGVQWRSSPHNLDQYRGKVQFSTLLADLRRHHSTPAISSVGKSRSKSTEKNASWTILAVPRRRKNAPVGQRLKNFSPDKTRKGAQGAFFHFFLAAVRAEFRVIFGCKWDPLRSAWRQGGASPERLADLRTGVSPLQKRIWKLDFYHCSSCNFFFHICFCHLWCELLP